MSSSSPHRRITSAATASPLDVPASDSSFWQPNFSSFRATVALACADRVNSPLNTVLLPCCLPLGGILAAWSPPVAYLTCKKLLEDLTCEQSREKCPARAQTPPSALTEGADLNPTGPWKPAAISMLQAGLLTRAGLRFSL